MRHALMLAALLSACVAAQAQSASAPAASASPATPSSPAKKELAQKLVAFQQGALENMARTMIEQPARQMLAAADSELRTRIAPEKRDAVASQIREHLTKYANEVEPLVKARALKIGQASLGPMFEEKFSEEELRQLVATLESPVFKKYQQTLPDFTNVYMQKLATELRPVLDPKLKALEQGFLTALSVPAPGASAPLAAKPAAPAAAASKPAKK